MFKKLISIFTPKPIEDLEVEVMEMYKLEEERNA